MNEYVKYIIVVISIIILDGIWIAFNMSAYQNMVKGIQKTNLKLNFSYAIIAYAFIILLSLYIVIPFAKIHMKKNDTVAIKLYKALIYGGVVGACVHGIYNFTNISLFENYDLKIVIADTLWGTFLYTCVVFIYSLM